MTFRHFKIFIEVCEKGSMSQAAQSLFISQSAISQTIKELEQHYNVTLFNRIAHKLYLTEDGKKLFDYARHIISYNNFIEESMMKQKIKQSLRIGAISGFILVDLSEEFMHQYPDVDITYIQDLNDHILVMLRSSNLDLAITDRAYNPDEFTSILFDRSPMSFVCSTDTKFPELQGSKPTLTIAQLSKLPLLLWLNNPSGMNEITSAFQKEGLAYNIKGRFINFDSIQRAVLKDAGIGLIGSQNVTDATPFFKRVKVEGLTINFDQYLVYHNHSEENPLIHKFIDFTISTIDDFKEHCLEFDDKIHS